MKNRFSPSVYTKALIVLVAAILVISPVRTSGSEGTDALQPESKHPLSAKVIAKLLRQFHYNHKKIDDPTSSEMLDLFIERYDRNRMYFLASDIAEFERYRYRLDDDLRAGELNSAYLIFNTLKMRIDQRIAYVERRLLHDFDYDIAETHEIDRSNSPWARDTQELDELWRRKLKNEALNLKLAGKEQSGIGETLTKRYQNLKRRIHQYNSEDVFSDFMNALSETYDPHTNYFSPISSENFGIDMSLSLEGIGAQLTTDGDHTKVVRILAGGPADRSKRLWANDKIVGVAQGLDGKMIDVVGMRLDDVVQKIRGPKGSWVRLDIIAADAPAGSPTKELRLIRDKVVLEERAARSDTVELIHDGNQFKLGVIEIPSFYIDLEAQRKRDPNYKSTTRDVRQLIRELEGADIDGLIIDLRRNGGGSLQEAIELTGLFIEDGPVVQVKSYIGSKKVESDPDADVAYSGPLAVIVDRFSASASEIFSSAIQDYGRGVVVGNQTYGKGTVQNLLALDRFIKTRNEKYGQVKVTVAKFYRITGSSTQHRGVIPDIVFPSIYDEMDFGEDKKQNALPWDEISPAIFRSHDQVSMFLSTLRLNSKKRILKNREIRYIEEDIAQYRAEKERNTISLREADRNAKRKQSENRKYERANERRLSRSLPPLQHGDKIEEEDQAPDVVLDEAKLILSDLIALTHPDEDTRVVKTAKKPKLGTNRPRETAGRKQHQLEDR